MRRRSLLVGTGAAAAGRHRRRPRRSDPVDVLLVLAVDVSRSVDEDEARLQREGYRAAVSDPAVVEAIRGGMIGAVGIAYVEWAGIEVPAPGAALAAHRQRGAMREAWVGEAGGGAARLAVLDLDLGRASTSRAG